MPTKREILDILNTNEYRFDSYVEGKYQKNLSYHPYIPTRDYMIVSIVDLLDILEITIKDKVFIDAGCGVPLIPDLFKKLGAKKAYGVEYDKKYCEKYKELIHADLLTYDFKEADIIYSYVPIIDENLMLKGLRNITNTMKKNSILIFLGSTLLPLEDDDTATKAFKKEFKKQQWLFYYIKK